MDEWLFRFINQGMASPVLDAVMPMLRDKVTWIPLYMVVVVMLWREVGARRTFYLLLCMGAVIGLADQLAAGIIKPLVARLRPCAASELQLVVRDLVGCGGKFGFPSNHATNHFAVAVVLCLTWVRSWPMRLGWLSWAALICLAQVYVGKHYPGDILAGAFLGSVIAYVGVGVYRRIVGPLAVGPVVQKQP